MKLTIIFTLLFLTISCNTLNTKTPQSVYSRHVGDIQYDSTIDSSNFKPCNGDSLIAQYFNYSGSFPLKREKKELVSFFQENYIPINSKGQSGRIRVRFIVNCEGKSGRFRLLEGNGNYNNFSFDKKISNQLLKLTKDIHDWKICVNNSGSPIDYYMYLTFIIQDGDLIDILP